MTEFNPEALDKQVWNVRKHRSKPHTGQVGYILSNNGKDIAELNYYSSNKEWIACIDNYPRQYKHYCYNFPVESLEQFILDMKRIGVDLKIFGPPDSAFRGEEHPHIS